MNKQLTVDDERAVDIALQAGKMSVMVVYDEVADALLINSQEAKELLADLVQRGVICERGEGARNVAEDPTGKSNPVAWFTRW